MYGHGGYFLGNKRISRMSVYQTQGSIEGVAILFCQVVEEGQEHSGGGTHQRCVDFEEAVVSGHVGLGVCLSDSRALMLVM